MINSARWHIQLAWCALACLASALPAQVPDKAAGGAGPRIIVDAGHPWRPPFGLDRVGAPLQVRVGLAAKPEANRLYLLTTYQDGRQTESYPLAFAGEKSSYWSTVKLNSIPDEVRLLVKDPAEGAAEELLRQPVTLPDLEADAVARPDALINPVDLGAVLVPQDWLLLKEGQTTRIEVAALCRSRSAPGVRLRAWFGDGKPVELGFPLTIGQRENRKLTVPFPGNQAEETLHIALIDGDRTLWQKNIRAMLVSVPPRWPSFGAIQTKLRYDAPISVIDSSNGAKLSPLDYDTAWDPKLNDVVVFLPNGSRFVFWRGTNYVPFWASRGNTGVSYQWAENLSIPILHADGTRDFPEPLYDFELRYSHVQIIESTQSRVHVRWTYQATDVDYRVWGDQAREDFYFYPDGFGTRVVTIASKPGSRYQLSEFLILTPQAAYPLEVLPSVIAEVLFLDGQKSTLRVPFEQMIDPNTGKRCNAWPASRNQEAIYRIYAQKEDPAAAIYFYPGDKSMALFSFTALYDQGQVVTPIYWGSHWPLGRGKITGWSIDDRIYASPAHNSLGGWLPNSDGKGGWGNWEVKPMESGQHPMLDTMGNARVMDLSRWSWLIGKTEASDEDLLKWAKSFAGPPSIQVTGAEVNLPSYSPERRAIRLIAKSDAIEIQVKPVEHTENPVFELDAAPKELEQVLLNGRVLAPDSYAWDGATLWVKADINAHGAKLGLQFRQPKGAQK